MASQIRFFEKNFLDLDNSDATVAASQGNELAIFARTRSLRSAWITTNSVDADNTTFEFDLGSQFVIDTILICDHNLKTYSLELYDAGTGLWSEIFSVASDDKDTTEISFVEFAGRRIRFTILGTQVANSDKKIGRIIVTRKLGKFAYWPKIAKPVHDQGRSSRKTLSGKVALLRTVGAFSFSLQLGNWNKPEDIALIEKLYRQVNGFETWLSGGDDKQFSYAAEGYRRKDIYLMGLSKDWSPEFANALYQGGIKVDIEFVEVVS